LTAAPILAPDNSTTKLIPASCLIDIVCSAS
jgi:hypothetical protein